MTNIADTAIKDGQSRFAYDLAYHQDRIQLSLLVQI